jgi:hypothetical protein
MLPQATASRKTVAEAHRHNEDDRIKHVCQ